MNKKSFNIYLNKSKSFNIIPFSLKKSFNIYLNNNKTFILYVNNIKQFVPGFFEYLANFRSSVVITAVSKLLVKGTTQIQAGQYNLIVNLRARKQSVPNFISGLLITTISRARFRNTLSFANNNILSITSRERSQNSINVFNAGISLTITPTLRGFYLLSDYDPDALSTMDSQSLAILDYYII